MHRQKSQDSLSLVYLSVARAQHASAKRWKNNQTIRSTTRSFQKVIFVISGLLLQDTEPFLTVLYFAKFFTHCYGIMNCRVELNTILANLTSHDRYRVRKSLGGASPFHSKTFIGGIDAGPSSLQEYKDHKMLYRIYFIIEKMFKAAVITLCTNHANKWLPESMSSMNREIVLVQVRSRCIAYAIWAGYKPPLSPVTILCDIVPLLYITEEMVIDSLPILFFK